MKLKKQAKILIAAVALSVGIMVIFCCYTYYQNTSTANLVIEVVEENVEIASQYVGMINQSESTNEYKKCIMKITAGTKLMNTTFAREQIFEKYVQMTGPSGTETLTSDSAEAVTHYAYSLLLVGDIIKTTNEKTNQVIYSIENAMLSYDRIPVVLYEDRSSVLISNTKGTKEKVVDLEEFTHALSILDQRTSMISW